MGFKLQDVAPRAGLHWVRGGLQETRRHPLAYASLLVMGMVGLLMLGSFPGLGLLLMLAGMPLLNLAFVMACQASQNGHSPGPGVFVAPWAAPGSSRRKRLAGLCAIYAGASMLAVAAGGLFDNGALSALIEGYNNPDLSAEQQNQLLEAPGVLSALLWRTGLTLLVNLPFWHAPALVVWSEQGPLQALFSSTVAIWRARQAFVLYGLAWAGVMAGSTLALTLLANVLGLGNFSGLLVVPVMLWVLSAYYVSQWHSFRACFVHDAAPRKLAA